MARWTFSKSVSIFSMRSSGRPDFSLNQSKASLINSPALFASISLFRQRFAIREASLAVTLRSASAPVMLIPVSINALGVIATTAMALSGQFAQHAPQAVHFCGLNTGTSKSAPLMV